MTTSNEKRGTLAVLALIFGIAAIVISWVPFVNFLSLLLAIAAMVLGVIEIRRIDTGRTPVVGKSFAIAGIILGAVAVVLGVALSFVLSLFVGGVWGFFNLKLF
jgi:tetrahydromethanopterin S-methyltransferase subunit C